MPVPKYYEMHKPFLTLLQDGNAHKLKELREYVSRHFRLTEKDLAELLPSGRQTVFVNRLGWARTYLKKSGLIESPARATFLITPEGNKVLHENPLVIDDAYLMRYESFRAFQNSPPQGGSRPPSDSDAGTPDDAFESAFQKINDSLADDLLGEVMKLSPLHLNR